MIKRFRVLKQSVVDMQTGLGWQRVHAGPMDWQAAMEYAKGLRLGKHADWRLPTIEELITLIDFSRHNPASAFPGMPSQCFWSSSSYAGSASHAWIVHFNGGYVSDLDKTYTNYVRCVRRGP